jgi:hypothetical protein
MGVGLVFGVLSGVPAALLVLAATGGRRSDDSSAYDDGYRAGMRETTALARGTRVEPVDDGKFSAEWMERMMAQRNAPAVIVMQQPAQKYTHAHPFGQLVNVRRTTTDNGVTLEENHLLPAEAARRLYGGTGQ